MTLYKFRVNYYCMLVIRLFRTGKKNQPSFKIVVTDKKNPPKGGRFVEQIGFYNPKTKEKVLNAERAKYWISKGAQPSATVHNMLVKEGVLEKAKMPKHGKSKKPVEAPKEEKKEEVLKEAPAPVEEKKEEAPAPVEEKKEEAKADEKPAEAPKQETPEEVKKEETPKTEEKAAEPQEAKTEETLKEEQK